MAEKSSTDVLAAGLLGLGAGVLLSAAIANQSTERRAAFVSAVRRRLGEGQVSLLGAEVGRQHNEANWLLTLRLPNGKIFSAEVPVRAELDPLSTSTAESVAQRVLTYLQAQGLVAA